MIRLLKYYRKYLAPILLVVALLFIQANADLALPDYMSGIVNIGLQQEGVPDSVPEIIRQSEMEKAFLFMDEGERKRVGSDYVLVAPDSAESRALSVKYPLMTGESHYLLRQAGSEERKALDSIFRQALAPLQFMESASADPQRALQFA